MRFVCSLAITSSFMLFSIYHRRQNCSAVNACSVSLTRSPAIGFVSSQILGRHPFGTFTTLDRGHVVAAYPWRAGVLWANALSSLIFISPSLAAIATRVGSYCHDRRVGDSMRTIIMAAKRGGSFDLLVTDGARIFTRGWVLLIEPATANSLPLELRGREVRGSIG